MMNDQVLDKLRDVVLFVAGLIAVGSMIMAAFEGFNQRVASASFLGTLGVVCTFLVFMPKLEVFKVWGFEARLNKTLDRAEEILEKMQHLSVSSAQSTYMSYAWTSRLDGPSAASKQLILDDVDKQLAELNVSAADRKRIVEPYVAAIKWEFYAMYMQVIGRYIDSRYNDLANHMNKGNFTDELNAKSSRWAALINSWRANALSPDVFAKSREIGLAELLQRAEPGDFLDQTETAALHRYRDELLRLFKDCENKGGYSTEAAAFHDRFSDAAGFDKKVIELFNYDPSAPR